MLLDTHFTGTGFLPFGFTVLLLIGIQDFLGRKLFISDTADIFHRCKIGLDITSLRVPVSPESVEIDELYAHWIVSYLCYTIEMTLVSPVILYFSSIIGSGPFCMIGL